jgi:hypothetical protein
MKTKKVDEFLKRALTLPKLKFAVVGQGTTWTLYEGPDLAKAVAQPGEQLIKASCVRKKEDLLAVAVIGEAAEAKIFKDKVFKKHLETAPKSMTFKVVSAKEHGALDALANEIDGTLVELVGRLPADKRNAAVALLNEAKELVAEGDLVAAQAKVQEIKTRTSGSGAATSGSSGGTGSSGGGTGGSHATPDEAAIRKRLLSRLRGQLVEQIAQLPSPRRLALTAPFNDAVKEATEGDLKAALLKLAQLEKAVAGGDPAASTAGAKPGQQPAQGVAPSTGSAQTAAQAAPKAASKPLPPTPQPKSLADLQDEVVAAINNLPDDLGPVFMGKHRAELIKLVQDTAGVSKIADATAARTKVLALRDRATAIRKLATDVSAMNKAMLALALAFPNRQRELTTQAAQAAASDDPAVLAAALAKMRQEHDRLKSEGPPKAAKAQATIEKATPEELAEMARKSYAECNALVENLRQGDPSTLEQRRAAMAKLFKAIPLDPKFQAKDDAKRRGVLDALKDPASGLAEAAKNWNKMPNPRLNKDGQPDPASMQKIKVLETALAIQCRQLGIDPPPKVKLFSDPASKVDDHQKQTCAGHYDPTDGNIYLNDQSPTIQNDFDNALDTIIHENTHNYQNKLMADLEAGKLKPGDDDYEQAMMFRLNSGKGGYIDSGDGYPEQPLERHAWQAGGEARKLFFADAEAEGRMLLEKMQKWVEANPGQAGSVPLWIGFMQKAVESGKSNEVADKMRTYEPEFKRVVAEAAERKGQVQADPAKALAAEMEKWLEEHPEHESRLRRLIEDLTSNAPTAKKRGWVERYPGIFEGVKAS